MRGFWTSYSYVGVMPDGRKAEFVSQEEYAEAYEAESDPDN